MLLCLVSLRDLCCRQFDCENFVVAEYAKLPLITPYLHPAYRQYTDGANFASAGAGALVGTFQGSVVDLHAQLRYFKNLIGLLRQKLGDAHATTLLGRAVYLFSIGTNDYIAPYASSRRGLLSHSREEYVDMVIGNLTIVIKEIHKNGGMKFGFQSLPPLGYLPSPRALNLIAVTEELTASCCCNLRREEFKEGKIACCGTGPYRGIYSCGAKRFVKKYELCDNPREYVFFDSGHPTQMANEQFAKLMWSGTLKDTGPYSLKMFEL
ncbi:GDSL esterase/lipase 5 [Morella rubra]|uniref:GDSL esterase/lipase 5 n=1 Tax=Morella rubra TaxID=262757 RepID=A0A6A1W2F4_9ROSI|nr:GDSL esterase/lipase 5 [Morella rubra]